MSLCCDGKPHSHQKVIFWLVPNIMVIGFITLSYIMNEVYASWWLGVIFKALVAFVCYTKLHGTYKFSLYELRNDLRKWSKCLVFLPLVELLLFFFFSKFFDPSLVSHSVSFSQVINNALNPLTYFHPVAEELIFRVGAFYLFEAWSLRVFGKIRIKQVILASAWVFGVSHFVNGIHDPFPLVIKILPIIYPLALGLIYGAIYAENRNIALPMIHHIWRGAVEKFVLKAIAAHLIR